MQKQMKMEMAKMKKSMSKIKMPKMPKMPKVKVSKKQVMIAGVAGVTLLCTIAGYSVYLVRNARKKLDLTKMKVQVIKKMDAAQSKMAPVAKQVAKMVAAVKK